MLSAAGYDQEKVYLLEAVFKAYQADGINGATEWSGALLNRFETSSRLQEDIRNVQRFLPFMVFSAISEDLIEQYKTLTSQWKDNSDFVLARVRAFDDWFDDKLQEKHNFSESDRVAAVVLMNILIHNNGYMTPADVD
jgi:hypothetical protein